MHNKRIIFCRWPGLALIIPFLFISIHVWAQTEPEFAIKGKGSFYLVGMGTGDPDLATARAMKIVQKADLIICSESLAERFTSVLIDKEVVLIPPMHQFYWLAQPTFEGVNY